MTQILFIRGNTAQNDSYTGELGSISIDTQLRRIRVHDGVTAGGHAAAKVSDVNDIIANVSTLTISQIVGLQAALDSLGTDKVDKTTLLTAGNGLTGGGDLSTGRTITLGTPGTITSSTTNSATATSHTHSLTVTKGDVGLSNVDNTSDANKPVSSAVNTALGLKVNTSLIGSANGIVPLGADSLISANYLPSYVDDVLEFSNLAGLPVTGETGKIYVTVDTNKQYRWSGTAYIAITSGAVDSVAGKTGVVTLVKGDVGLGNVDNTSDTTKPVSTAQQSALNLKANLNSPALTGAPTAPTQTVSDNSTKIATTAYVTSKIGALTSGVSSVSGTAPITVGGTASNPIIAINAATTSLPGSLSAADKSKLDGIATGAQVNTVTSVAGRTGTVVVSKTDVGLSNVQNYSVATDAQMTSATSVDTAYVTPIKVRKFIEDGDYVIDLGTFV